MTYDVETRGRASRGKRKSSDHKNQINHSSHKEPLLSK
jgi:hypothetical protein